MAYRTLKEFRLNGYKNPPKKISTLEVQLGIVFVVVLGAIIFVLL